MTYPSEAYEKAQLIKHMLDALETPSKELTKWGEDFIPSAREQFELKGHLTYTQFDILEKIYSEKTA